MINSKEKCYDKIIDCRATVCVEDDDDGTNGRTSNLEHLKNLQRTRGIEGYMQGERDSVSAAQ